MRSRVAVVGGGILGLATALLAVGRGFTVTLIEREPELFSRASANNEGKVHLGLVYALSGPDTLGVMLDGALSFCQILDRACGSPLPWDQLSTEPFDYLVMPDSLLDAEELSRFYRTANGALDEHPMGQVPYLGSRLDRLVDPTPFHDEQSGLTGFHTAERAVNPRLLGAALVSAVERHPDIRVLAGSPVTHLRQADSQVEVGIRDQPSESFDLVVNCAWEGRQALLPPSHRQPLSYRVKSAVRVERRPSSTEDRTVTLVVGPYGDVVSHADHLYLSWYPTGRLSRTTGELAGEDPLASMQAADRERLIEQQLGSLRALGLVGTPAETPPLRSELVGGFILASGSDDIDDRGSGLHHRQGFGTQVVGRVLTPRNFKFSTAPRAALDVVDEIGRLL